MTFETMTGHVYLFGEIGKQVTLNTVLKEIDPKFTNYVLHVHSPGGDVFEGYAIYNALKNTGKEITGHIEGVCASITTLIVSAASKIIMNTKSQFMIHNPRISNMSGESKDLRNVAAQLDKIKTQLIDSWLGRTSLSVEQLSEMYDNETWLTPEQAKAFGFVDEIQEVLKAVASFDLNNYKMVTEDKTPTILQAIDNLGNRISASIASIFKNKAEIKNMTDTLADGTVIQVESEDGDWTGKKVTYSDGSNLPPGDYTLASGKTMTVGEESKIASVKEAEAKSTETPEDMELKSKLESAEAKNAAYETKIKELESALTARNDVAAKAEAKAKSFENKFVTELKQVQDELAKIKNTTVGDTTPVDLGAKKGFDPSAPIINDPMTAFFKQSILSKRNTD